MAIKVKLFASLAESLGRREASLAFVDGMTAATVWEMISGQSTVPSGVMIAVNMSYCDGTECLHDGDEVAYFPPVTGG